MKAIKILLAIVLFACVSVMSTDVLAETTMKKSVATETTASKTADMTSGEVRKIDKEGGKLTLRHDKIENLNMPAMTMVFRVKDKGMLDTIQVGDKVKFKAVKDNGKLTVTNIKVDQ